MEKHPMTPDGYAKLKEELSRLKNKERPYIIGEIATAREHGDLSENAEYHAAKDRQGMIEARISILESTIGLAEVIDISDISNDRIQFGASVTVIDEETEEETTLTRPRSLHLAGVICNGFHLLTVLCHPIVIIAFYRV